MWGEADHANIANAQKQIQGLEPVPAFQVRRYNVTLPEGYVKKGNFYSWDAKTAGVTEAVIRMRQIDGEILKTRKGPKAKKQLARSERYGNLDYLTQSKMDILSEIKKKFGQTAIEQNPYLKKQWEKYATPPEAEPQKTTQPDKISIRFEGGDRNGTVGGGYDNTQTVTNENPDGSLVRYKRTDRTDDKGRIIFEHFKTIPSKEKESLFQTSPKLSQDYERAGALWSKIATTQKGKRMLESATALRENMEGLTTNKKKALWDVYRALNAGGINKDTAIVSDVAIRNADENLTLEALNETWTKNTDFSVTKHPGVSQATKNRILGQTEMEAAEAGNRFRRAKITLLVGANPTTVIHEMYHSIFWRAPKVVREAAARFFLGKELHEVEADAALWRQMHEEVAEAGTRYYLEEMPKDMPTALALWFKRMANKFKDYIGRAAKMDNAPEILKRFVDDVAHHNTQHWISEWENGLRTRKDLELYQTEPADTIDVDGVQRPTTNSKGQPIHPTEAGTRNFWKWFGDSKVVDEQGRPLVVYHGTNQPIDSFDTKRLGASTSASSAREGFFFTSSHEQSGEYANLSARNVVSDVKIHEKKSAQLMRDMERAEKKGDWDTVERLTVELENHELGASREGVVGASVVPTYLTMTTPAVVEINGQASVGQVSEIIRNAKKSGNDGVILKGIEDSPETMSRADHYVIFDSSKIKSATGNRGTFDASNPNILFQTDSPVLSEILNPDSTQDYELPAISEKRYRFVGEDPDRVLTPEQKTALINTGGAIEVKSIRERWAKFKEHAWKTFKQGVFDQFDPLLKFGKEVYMQARLSKTAANAVAAIVGVPGQDGKLHGGKLYIKDGIWAADTSGCWMEKVIQPLKKEAHYWARWVAGNRAAELLAEGKERLFSDADIRAYQSFADGEANFDYTLSDGTVTRVRKLIYADALKKHTEFNKNVLDMLEATGDIDPETRKIWEKDFFIPFNREQNDEMGEQFQGTMAKDGLVRQDAIKRLKGGREKLNANLIDNIVMNWYGLLDASAKNRAAKLALLAAEEKGCAHTAQAGEKNAVWYMGYDKEGKHGKQYFVVDDPYVFKAITALTYAGMKGPMMKQLTQFKRWMTTGVTISPAFKIRNLIRDSVQCIAVAEMGYNPAKNIKEGLKITKDWNDTYAAMFAGGGIIEFGPELEGNEIGRIHKYLPGVDRETVLDTPGRFINSFFKKHVKPALDAYEAIGNRGETVNRAALYKEMIAQGKSHLEATFLARDLMDFSMSGTFTTLRFLNQTVPFLNARIQGLYKLGKGAKANPQRFTAVLGATALASISLMAMYKDDDDWKKRTDADRNNYWWFKFGGTAFRIPKPFEIGAIATVAERGAEVFLDKEMTGKRFGENVLKLLGDNLSMNPVPQAVRPIIDIYANKDGYSGAPIETMGMDKLTPSERYRPTTSMAARGISKGMNAASGLIGKEALSPVQVDYLVKGYFAWLGTFCVAASDILVRPLSDQPSRPTPDYTKMLSAGFLSELPENSSRYVSQMYDQLRTLEEAYTTYQDKVKRGDVSGAQEFMASHREELGKYRAAEHVKTRMSDIGRSIRMVEAGNLDPDIKQKRIQALKAQQDKLARSIQ